MLNGQIPFKTKLFLYLFRSNFGVVRSKLHTKMKVLNVAEKNDAAKSIAAVMSKGASQRVSGDPPEH